MWFKQYWNVFSFMSYWIQSWNHEHSGSNLLVSTVVDIGTIYPYRGGLVHISIHATLKPAVKNM